MQFKMKNNILINKKIKTLDNKISCIFENQEKLKKFMKERNEKWKGAGQ